MDDKSQGQAGEKIAVDRPRVLICDDSRIVRATIIKHIKNGFDIKEAVDGEAGYAALVEDHEIQVLISDLSMPKLDGFGLLARLRASADPRLKEMPVIIISGEEEGVAREKAAAAGATDFISKGIGALELQSRLEALVKLNRATRQLEKSREAIAQTATTDPLTGLGTPHFLMLRGAQIYAHSQRRVNDVAVIRVFLDTQGASEKRFGKPVADQLLVFIGKLLSARMRKEDCIARVSDAEFAMICPSTALSNANQFATRLKDAIATAKVNFKEEFIKYTASVGVANTDMDEATSIEGLFELAGSRMQGARAQGGNTMVSSDDSQSGKAALVLSVDEALNLLSAGETERITGHLPELLARQLPLLKLLDQHLDLKLPLAAMEQAAQSKK